jgi:hypothetical protein
MSCEKIYQHIDLKISDQEFKEHLASCEYCREMNSKINQTLSLLDIESKVPENMTDRILSAKKGRFKTFQQKGRFFFGSPDCCGSYCRNISGNCSWQKFEYIFAHE